MLYLSTLCYGISCQVIGDVNHKPMLKFLRTKHKKGPMTPGNTLKSCYVSWKIEGVGDNVSKWLFHFYCHVKLKVGGRQTQAVMQDNWYFKKVSDTRHLQKNRPLDKVDHDHGTACQRNRTNLQLTQAWLTGDQIIRVVLYGFFASRSSLQLAFCRNSPWV